MIRLLFWALIAWLAYIGVRKLAADVRRPAPVPAEDMVRCARCQLNLPKSEAIAFEGGWACCAEHARAPAARP